MGKGGSNAGSSSGKVDFPGYMKTKHEDWLSDMNAELNLATDNSPYENIGAFDPSSVIETINTERLETNTKVDSMDYTTDFGTQIARAETELEISAINTHSFNSIGNSLLELDTRLQWDEFFERALKAGKLGSDFNWTRTRDEVIDGQDLSTISNWNDIIAAITPIAEGITDSDEVITERVAQFVTSQNAVVAKRKGQHASTIASTTDVLTSAFVVGAAMLERDSNRAAEEFESGLRVEAFNQKVMFITQHTPMFYGALAAREQIIQAGIDSFVRLLISKNQTIVSFLQSQTQTDLGRIQAVLGAWGGQLQVEGGRITANLQATQIQSQMFTEEVQKKLAMFQMEIESGRIEIIAGKEQVDREIDIEVKDAIWNMQLYQYAGNLLGSAGGGTAVYDTAEGSAKNSGLMGGLSGAMTGAAGGFLVGGPVGAVIGGIGGAVLGGLQ